MKLIKVMAFLFIVISFHEIYAGGGCPRCEINREKNKTAPACGYYEDYLQEQAQKSGQPLPDNKIQFEEEQFNVENQE